MYHFYGNDIFFLNYYLNLTNYQTIVCHKSTSQEKLYGGQQDNIVYQPFWETQVNREIHYISIFQ